MRSWLPALLVLLSIRLIAQAPEPTLHIPLAIGWLDDKVKMSEDDLRRVLERVTQIFGPCSIEFELAFTPTELHLYEARVDLTTLESSNSAGRVPKEPEQYARLQNLPLNIRIVRDISGCGASTSNKIEGCSGVGSGSVTIRRYQDTNSVALRNIVWAHELAHGLGLEHDSANGNLMRPTTGLENVDLTPDQCSVLRQNADLIRDHYDSHVRHLLAISTPTGGPTNNTPNQGLTMIAQLGTQYGLWETQMVGAAGGAQSTGGTISSSIPNIAIADNDGFVVRASDYPPFTASQRVDFIREVSQGKGVLEIHTLPPVPGGWPEYDELIGGSLNGTEVFANEGTVTAPIPSRDARVRHLSNPFPVMDQVFVVSGLNSTDTEILAALATPEATPLLWTRSVGRGRIYYSSIGHDDAVLTQEPNRTTVLEAIKWILQLSD